MSDYQTTEQDAFDRLVGVPPALVEAVQENPEVLRPVARSMAAINLHNLFVRMQDPNTSNRDRMEFQQLLHKLGELEAKPKENREVGEGFKIVINIPAVPGVTAPSGQIIEACAVEKPELLPAPADEEV